MSEEDKSIILKIFKGFYGLIYSAILLVGVVFIIVGAMQIHMDKVTSREYVETTGKLVGYKKANGSYRDREHRNDYYGIYKFEVDGKEYKTSPDKISTKSGFRKTIKVKYNPANPDENIAESGWPTLIIAGIGLVIAFFVLVYKNYKDTKRNLEYYANHKE